MEITELEKQVVARFLADPELRCSKSSLRWEVLKVRDRSMTGTGFLTEFEQSDELKVLKSGESQRWGKVGARLNSEGTETGYLVYVDNGYLTTVEGYTYGEAWPEQIRNVEFYELREGMELKNPPPPPR